MGGGGKEPRVQTRDMPPIVRIIMTTILLLILKGNFFFFLILCAKVGQGCWTLLNCCWKTVYSESRQISLDNDSESVASEARLKSNSCFLCVLPKASIIQSCPCKFHLNFKENYKRIQIKIKYLDFDIFRAQFTHCTSHFCPVARG